MWHHVHLSPSRSLIDYAGQYSTHICMDRKGTAPNKQAVNLSNAAKLQEQRSSALPTKWSTTIPFKCHFKFPTWHPMFMLENSITLLQQEMDY